MRKKKVKISPFAKQVYSLCRQIPRGKVSTYQEIATALGSSGASRAVGQALHRNPYSPKVPCHRVINAKGELGGFANGKVEKRALLEKEGIVIKKEKIDLSKYFKKLAK